MKGNLKKIFVGSILVFAIISLYYILKPSYYYYENDYLDKFGLKNMYSYDEVKKKKNNLIRNETMNEDKWITLHFEGFQVTFNEQKMLASIKISSPDYRFGRNKVGIGSSRKEIEKAYSNQFRVIDTRDNEIGFIDGYEGHATRDSVKPWVFFELDNDNIVTGITLCPNGMF